MKNYIIPIFIPHYGCSHQCVFCNQKKITGITTPVTALDVNNIINSHVSRINQPRYVEVAFYGGSFTALPLSKQQELIAPAYQAVKDRNVQAIRLSTRPDYINNEIINNLVKFGVTTIELGVQSLDNSILLASERGHTVQDVKNAVNIIRHFDIKIGIQLMVGLPTENMPSLYLTAQESISLRPDFARIYPTLVIAETGLAEQYRSGKYQPLSLDSAVKRCAYLKCKLEQNGIPIIRTGLQATADLDDACNVLAGPYHPAFGELVDSFIMYYLVIQLLESMNISENKSTILKLHFHTRDTSKLRGNKNVNIIKLKSRFSSVNFEFYPDHSKIGEIVVEYGNLIKGADFSIIDPYHLVKEGIN